jgi:uncharacterized protein YjlB
MTDRQWSFIHHLASEAKWTPGLREIFEYRDLGIKDGTNGDYVVHLVRHNGKKTKDEVQQWHVHDCTFQLVYVLNGWATFEYEGQGQRTIRTGDCILQTPGIKHREIVCSEDFEVLEIVSPGEFYHPRRRGTSGRDASLAVGSIERNQRPNCRLRVGAGMRSAVTR